MTKPQVVKAGGWEVFIHEVETGRSCGLVPSKRPMHEWRCAEQKERGISTYVVDCKEKKVHLLDSPMHVYHEEISRVAGLEKKELNNTQGRYQRLTYMPYGKGGELSAYSVNRSEPEKEDSCLCDLGRSGLVDLSTETLDYVEETKPRHITLRDRCMRSRE